MCTESNNLSSAHIVESKSESVAIPAQQSTEYYDHVSDCYPNRDSLYGNIIICPKHCSFQVFHAAAHCSSEIVAWVCALAVLAKGAPPKSAANWVMGDILGYLKVRNRYAYECVQ